MLGYVAKKGSVMDANLKTGIWQQVGAVLDYLAETIRACPDHLWHAPLYDDPPFRRN